MSIRRKPRAPTVARAKTPVQTPVPPLIEQEHGGALFRGGTGAGGRPKEVLRRRCREEIETRNGIEFVGRVMDGTETEDVRVSVGSGWYARIEVIRMRPRVRDRLHAFELLCDRGYGKPGQVPEIEDERPRLTHDQRMAHIIGMLPQLVRMLPGDAREELARLLVEQRRIDVLVSGRQVKDGGSGNRDATAGYTT